MKSSELIPLLVGSSGITAVAAAVVSSLFQRSKFKAEATSIISNAAGGLVTNVMADNVSLRAEKAELEAKVDNLEEKYNKERQRGDDLREVFREFFEAYRAYSQGLADTLRTAGYEVEDPPPVPKI